MKGKGLITLLVPVLLVALASAAPLTVTISNFREAFREYRVYTAAGEEAGSGTVENNAFTFEYDPARTYIVKVEGDATLIFTIPSGITATSYTVTPTNLANVTVKVVFDGPGFKPSAVTFTVSISNYPNLTAVTGKRLYTAVPATLTFPESIYFPAIYGYRLANITVNGAAVTTATITTAGAHTVEVVYQAAGLATLPPMMLFAGFGIIVVLAALLAMRSKGVQSAAVAVRSPYLEP